MRKGSMSRALVEEIQIGNRMRRIEKASKDGSHQWQPPEVKKATKEDFYKLLKSINNQEQLYEEDKKKKKALKVATRSPP